MGAIKEVSEEESTWTWKLTVPTELRMNERYSQVGGLSAQKVLCINLNFQDKDFGVCWQQSGAVHHSYHYQLHHLQNIEKEGTTVALDGH